MSASVPYNKHQRRKGRHDPIDALSWTSEHDPGEVISSGVLSPAAIRSAPFTFKVEVQIDDVSAANGVIFEYGNDNEGIAVALDQGTLIAAAGGLGDDGVDGSAEIFFQDGQRREITVAVLPGTGQLQVWSDGIRVIDETAVAGSFPFWSASE